MNEDGKQNEPLTLTIPGSSDAAAHEKLSKQINDLAETCSEVGRRITETIAEQAKDISATAEQLLSFTTEHEASLKYCEITKTETLLSNLEAFKKRDLITRVGLGSEFNDALNMAIREGEPKLFFGALTIFEIVGLYGAFLSEPETLRPKSGYYILPQSPATSAIFGVLSASKYGQRGLREWADRKTKADHGKIKVSVNEKGEARQAEIINGNKYSITIEIADITEAISGSAPAMKAFLFILAKANKQVLHSGEFNGEDVVFSLEEFREVSEYKSIDSAYHQLIKGTRILQKIIFHGKCNRDKREYSAAQLISGVKTKNNSVTIKLNDWINWSFLTQFFTIIPDYIFSLSPRAVALLLLVFTQARTSIGSAAAKIERGQLHINLSHETISRWLNLQPAEGNANPERTIYAEITEAILDIGDIESKRGENIQFIPHGQLPRRDKRTTTEAAEYYEVIISGEYAEPLIAFGDKKTDVIDKANKRREKLISTKAKAKAEAEAKIEAAAAAKTTE